MCSQGAGLKRQQILMALSFRHIRILTLTHRTISNPSVFRQFNQKKMAITTSIRFGLVMLAPAFSHQGAEEAYEKISDMVRALSTERIGAQISGDSPFQLTPLVRRSDLHRLIM